MKRIPVDPFWTLSTIQQGTELRIPATVPGNVQLDLMRAQILPDPYFADQVHLLIPWELSRWCYECKLEVPRVDPTADRVILHFDGIDTIAQIRIDGEPVASSENMFVPVEIDLTDHAGRKVGIEVIIESVIAHEWNRERSARAGTLPYNYESLYVRKARHSFGWDIAPRIVTSGIWRPVRFEIRGTHEITGLYAYTIRADESTASIGIDWNCRLPVGDRECRLVFCLTAPDGVVVSRREIAVRFPTGREFITIDRPELWWPAGYGDPNLYTLSVELIDSSGIRAAEQLRIGIRTVQLLRTDAIDGRKKEFRFVVNNEPLFVRGSNWVPADAFHSRCSARCEENLRPYIDSDCNMLRIWGGGIYEDDLLFDLCDTNGIMIWQDFMFACETPPRDTEYHMKVEIEVAYVATRYRNHPSLVLWCGDNENDMAMRVWNGARGGTNELTRKIIPEVLADHDPYRPYLPSSPFVGEAVWEEHLRTGLPIIPMIPEQHLWGPRDAFKGDFYRLNNAIFASEIGYHGAPSTESMRKFLEPEAIDRSTEIGRRQWITHAAQPYGDLDGRYAYRIELMEQQIGMLFGEIPAELDRFVAASQISQAEAKKFFIEQFRMRKWEKSGIIWWNMQDMWPQFSDAVIDYYGEKKLAWYYIARAQTPVCLAIAEPSEWKHSIVAMNDTRNRVHGSYRVFELEGGYDSGRCELSIPPNESRIVGNVGYHDSRTRLYLIEWETPQGSGSNHYIASGIPWSLDTYLSWLPGIFDGTPPDTFIHGAPDTFIHGAPGKT